MYPRSGQPRSILGTTFGLGLGYYTLRLAIFPGMRRRGLPDHPLTRTSHTLSTAARDKAVSTSLRSGTVLNVLFKYASALTFARLVSTAFSRASLRNCVRNAGLKLSFQSHLPLPRNVVCERPENAARGARTVHATIRVRHVRP